MGEWIEREVVITVKAYPVPSSTYQETSCTAAISREDGWLRLYPLRFRDLPRERQFRKYQLVKLRMAKHAHDTRPESYRPDESSLAPGRILGTEGRWAERKEWILPTASPSMCAIQGEQRRSGRSLGVFRPGTVRDLDIIPVEAEWSGRQRAKMAQLWFDDLKGRRRIEKIPYVFKYRYVCLEARCKGHTQTVIDWELMQLFRRLRDRGLSQREVERAIREKYLNQICGPARDTYFFVGNHSRYRRSFMVLGVFWPPKTGRTLFDES